MARTKVDKVKYVLETYPETRDDDQKLIVFYYWCFYRDSFLEQDGRQYVAVDALLIADAPETIRRTRQKLQEKGLYPSSEQVKAIRAERAEEFAQTMPREGWENTING